MTIIDERVRLATLMSDLIRLVHQRSTGEMWSLMADAQISMPQFVTLQMLSRCEALSISAIAGRLRLSLAATSHLVDQLVRQGFVERSEDPTDRRQKRVELASPGRALLEQLVEARSHEMTVIMSALPPELCDQFEHVLGQVVEQLEHGEPRPTT